MFDYSMMPIINKPKCVNKKTSTALLPEPYLRK